MVYIIVEKCHWSTVKWFVTIKGTRQTKKILKTRQQITDALHINETEMTKLQNGGPIERELTEEKYKELINAKTG